MNRPLDTRIEIETPEGIDMLLRPAGLVSRSLAFGIDLAIRAGVIGILFMLLQLFDKLGMGLAAIAIFLVNWWYMVLFEVLNQGRTPGKRMLGLRVVHDDGTPVDWSSSVIRNLLRFVDMLPLGYSLGAVSCLNHPLFKRLGDLAAGTLVIYSDRPALRPVVPPAEPIIVPFALRLDEQRAVLSLAERQGELSSARTQELAAILAEPLRIPADQAVLHVNGIARSLLGPT
ncbi:RDD domain-containing protein [Pseudomonas cannabina pv. alisalensis]|uniref:RDD domain-containing protein n=1 Tax=Pseudomonas cannabina TaxID=86840 RepID=A0A3M3RV38_PSECA|nr:RDD-like protein domain-containing protein [Pseudomonas syringae pv. maculicola]KPW15787.1 RDD domain-containing protein [Pseudomonas cannabina pv. alisalensis]RMN74905.1 RDD domain-containing protein [Pseudomonas cannabina]RMN79181.1 RDD domain-containing protein [Pseudomonas cannabina pv. alisalensis]RMO00280.1 RDD domain-containing protein [Pseudomonas cannabina]